MPAVIPVWWQVVGPAGDAVHSGVADPFRAISRVETAMLSGSWSSIGTIMHGVIAFRCTRDRTTGSLRWEQIPGITLQQIRAWRTDR